MCSVPPQYPFLYKAKCIVTHLGGRIQVASGDLNYRSALLFLIVDEHTGKYCCEVLVSVFQKGLKCDVGKIDVGVERVAKYF